MPKYRGTGCTKSSSLPRYQEEKDSSQIAKQAGFNRHDEKKLFALVLAGKITLKQLFGLLWWLRPLPPSPDYEASLLCTAHWNGDGIVW